MSGPAAPHRVRGRPERLSGPIGPVAGPTRRKPSLRERYREPDMGLGTRDPVRAAFSGLPGRRGEAERQRRSEAPVGPMGDGVSAPGRGASILR